MYIYIYKGMYIDIYIYIYINIYIYIYRYAKWFEAIRQIGELDSARPCPEKNLRPICIKGTWVAPTPHGYGPMVPKHLTLPSPAAIKAWGPTLAALWPVTVLLGQSLRCCNGCQCTYGDLDKLHYDGTAAI